MLQSLFGAQGAGALRPMSKNVATPREPIQIYFPVIARKPQGSLSLSGSLKISMLPLLI